MLEFKEESREEAFAKIWDAVPEKKKQELIDKYAILTDPSLRKDVMKNYSRKVRKVTIK